jgi:hypothetical protein
MPDDPLLERICPYLRGRQGLDPALEPTPGNLCALVSSLHLPTDQQRTYCLSGDFTACPRYQRQAGRPLPRYVRGAQPLNVRPAAPATPIRPLPWRQPWARTALKWIVMALLLVVFLLLWRWRVQQIPPFVVERDEIPTVVLQATPTISPRYLPPTAGPPPW